MLFIYISALPQYKRRTFPYQITIKNSGGPEIQTFSFRPESDIPMKVYQAHHLDKKIIQSAPFFYDLADELIDILQNQQLVFVDGPQFQLLKALFAGIGYNFRTGPKFIFHGPPTDTLNDIASYLETRWKNKAHSTAYAMAFVELMQIYLEDLKLRGETSPQQTSQNFSLTSYRTVPGVYYFLDTKNEVIYVGKAKNIRKRLQSHFSKKSSKSNIIYSEVKHINVIYSGNDIIAQLMESADIKSLKPLYNTQQIVNPAPYIINKGKTAKGIAKLQITRKDIQDNMPEKYFNRRSVIQSLESFCTAYQLCRKYCGLERIKGPCSNVTEKHRCCVCAGNESIETYNKRFEIAFYNFQRYKTRKIYKLKGRTSNEDAFVYLVNGIYEGYGFIDKEIPIVSVEDILGHLTYQSNNYDTSRIVSYLDKVVPIEQILDISSD